MELFTRILPNGREIIYQDDNTVDMGSSFDVLDPISYIISDQISEDPEEQKYRNYFQSILRQVGFKPYSNEWWHFTLENEPFLGTYFDFDVK